MDAFDKPKRESLLKLVPALVDSKKKAESTSFFGVGVKDLSRDELLAALGCALEDARKADEMVEKLLEL